MVDCQRDFMPGGALAVPRGQEVVAPLAELASSVDMVIATQDYHPRRHCSFDTQGGPWPEHCVEGSIGAQIWPDLDFAHYVVRKGMEPDADEYSAALYIDAVLNRRADEVLVGGLATEYCVKATAIDLARMGYNVTVVKEATRWITAKGADEALAEMRKAGVRLDG